MTLMLIETKNHSAKTSRPEFIINPSNLVRWLVVNFIFYNLKYGNEGMDGTFLVFSIQNYAWVAKQNIFLINYKNNFDLKEINEYFTWSFTGTIVRLICPLLELLIFKIIKRKINFFVLKECTSS